MDMSLSNKKLKAVLPDENLSLEYGLRCLKNPEPRDLAHSVISKKIPYGRHSIDEVDAAAVQKTLLFHPITQGPTIELFERKIAEYCGAEYAVAVSSATAGLHLSYLALGLKNGDSVVVSPNTFVSTANASLYCGGSVKFADIDPKTLDLDPNNLHQLLTDGNVKIVAPTIFGGSAEGIIEVCRQARDNKKLIVEDAAHGLGGKYSCGSKIGSCKYSDCTVFSLHPVKSIAAGEGGVITTNDPELNNIIKTLRSHGIQKDDPPVLNNDSAQTVGSINPWYYEMVRLGYHYRLTDIQASLALSQLGKIESFLERRRDLANRYDEWVHDKPHIYRKVKVDVQGSANHLYCVDIDFKELGMSRRDFMINLREDGIFTQVHYIPVTNHPFYQMMGYKENDHPHAAAHYNSTLSLPIYYGLKEQQFSYIKSRLETLLTVS